MGCCHSVPNDEPVWRPQGPAPAADVCFPDKFGHGGVKVFASCANAADLGGRIFSRLVVGQNWMFAALFEAHGTSADHGDGSSTSLKPFRDAAAQYCAEHCHTEFLAASKNATAGSGTTRDVMLGVLSETLRALDKRFLKDTDIPQQDRLGSGCSAVLLHMDLGATDRVATAATVGPCAAVVGQRRGGLASATSCPLVLCGGAAASHDALQEFLSWMALESESIEATAAKAGGGASMKRRKLANSSASSTNVSADPTAGDPQQRTSQPARPQQEPRYSQEPGAPAALGFGCAKGMGWTAGGGVTSGGAMLSPRRKPRLGLAVQTASQVLGPADECVVLLSSGAAAAITPADVALLMHRMGHLSGIPYETKPQPLPLEDSGDAIIQLDSMGVAGPRTTPMASAAAAPVCATPRGGAGAGRARSPPVPPFNAARLLVQHATAGAAARGKQQCKGTGAVQPPAAGIMAFALEWPVSSGGDTVAAAAASGASVSAIRAAAAAAARDRRRGLYLWQLLRMYYKVPYKSKVATIKRWHELFDQLVAKAAKEARSKEVTAWKRLGAVLQVSNAGNVKSVTPQHQPPASARTPIAAPQSARYRSPRSSNATGMAAAAAAATPHSVSQPVSRQPSPRATPTSARYRSPRPSPRPSPGPTALFGSPPPAAPSSARYRSPSAARLPMSTSNAAVAGLPPASPVCSNLLDADGVRMRVPTAKQASRPSSARELQRVLSSHPSAPEITGGLMVPAGNAATDADTVADTPLTRPSPLIDVAPGGVPAWRQDADRSSGSAYATPTKAAMASNQEDGVIAEPVVAQGSPEIRQGGPRVSLISNVEISLMGLPVPVPPASTDPTPTEAASPAPAGTCPVADAITPSASQPRQSSGAHRSLIPTLQLQLIPANPNGGPTSHHTTPRLSAPGGLSSGLPTPPTATPPARTNNTCGGAINSTPTAAADGAASGAVTSARGPASSRLPRPSASPTTSAGGAHAPSPSSRLPSPSVSAGGAVKPPGRSGGGGLIPRPPQLDVSDGGQASPGGASARGSKQPDAGKAVSKIGSSVGGATGAPSDTSLGGGGAGAGIEVDLLSPNADQLAVWAMEAVAIIASPRQKEGLEGKPGAVAQALPPAPRQQLVVTSPAGQEAAPQQQQQLLQQGLASGGRGGKIGGSIVRGIASGAAAAGGAGVRTPGSARQVAGSRIPLSPRDDNHPSARGTPRISTPRASTPRDTTPRTSATAATTTTTPRAYIAGGKSVSALGSGTLGASAAEVTSPALRASSMRARR